MSEYERVRNGLIRQPRRWLVTGAAGFIGSNLVEALLRLDQHVIGIDNFATGYRRNLDDVRRQVGPRAWRAFNFIEADIQSPDVLIRACKGVDYVLHNAALGSVPRSVENPRLTHECNVTGFLNILLAARDAQVSRFVFAGSSAVYGDEAELPKLEERIGNPLSPYALTKRVNELYADTFARCYGVPYIGLRYFNVFGPRQDPNGAYAAVIPRWTASMIADEPVYIYGDGETTRDFCYVENVVQANILAATTGRGDALNRVYNIAVNGRTSLNELYETQRSMLIPRFPHVRNHRPTYAPFREGDVRHSQADISRAVEGLGYHPTYTFEEGLELAMDWYVRDAIKNRRGAVQEGIADSEPQHDEEFGAPATIMGRM